jgi:hypothetical protein
VFRQQLLELLDILELLRFDGTPEFLQTLLAVGIGNVLIKSPNTVQPSAQVVNQIVIVILASLRFSNELVFGFGFRGHSSVPFRK